MNSVYIFLACLLLGVLLSKARHKNDWKFGESWTCRVCGDRRPDASISVLTLDLSSDYHASGGTVKQHIRHCNDRPGCVEGAITKRLVKRVGDRQC